MARTSLQAFEYRDIPRASIFTAGYNPRKISETARKKLSASLSRVGCVEPLVWNAKTRTLVSGHQRLAELDRLHGNQDYDVGVAVVELDIKAERGLNVMLNNQFAQGEFSRELMAELLKQEEDRPTLDDIGFTMLELEMTVGALRELDGLFAEEQAPAEQIGDTINSTIAEIKAAKKKHKDQNDISQWEDCTYYLVIACDTIEEKRSLLTEIGLSPDTHYINAIALRDKLDPDTWPTEDTPDENTAPDV